MNLFLKIFLWFLAAISLIVGVIAFLNWTVQTEPVVSRWRISMRNQSNIYASTAAQILEEEGRDGFEAFIARLRAAETVSEVLVLDYDQVFKDERGAAAPYDSIARKAFESDSTEIEYNEHDGSNSALSAKQFAANGNQHVMVIRWERPRLVPFFGESPLRFARFGIVLLTGLLLCWALAAYLSLPIGKLRLAAQKLAEGDLSTRVADQIGNRKDELASLAKDFDVMAERIESLITSQKRLSRDVSHELRSPLARMNVALEIAKQKANPETAPILERIEGESNRLNEMISRLLTLFKLEAGAEEFESRELDFRSLVSRVVSDANFEAKAKGKAVKIQHADECQVTGNESLLSSAVENVLRNAIRYTPIGSEVSVTLQKSGGQAVLLITDHGGGVPDEELKNLFRPFYRVGEARDRGTGGTGLGLAIAEQAVRRHKGTVKARNINDGLEVEIKLASI